jgi:tetratricopeptide (TPR) repeat protein
VFWVLKSKEAKVVASDRSEIDLSRVLGEQGYKVAELITAGRLEEARKTLYPLYREHMTLRFTQSALMLQMLAKLYVKVGNIPEAFELLEQAQELCEFACDSVGQVRILNDMGDLYLENVSGSRQEAIDCYMRALALALRTGMGLYSNDFNYQELREQIQRSVECLSIFFEDNRIHYALKSVSEILGQ